MVAGDSFALKVFARQLNTLQFDKVKVLDPHSDAAAAAIDNFITLPGKSVCCKARPCSASSSKMR